MRVQDLQGSATKFLLLIMTFLSLVRCDLPRGTQPSVLMIAVEGLSVDSLSCDADEMTERAYVGIRPFCEEAVRFSHAFAPSPMSQATMASLLTGLYPFDHGVHHNGSEYLSAKFKTVAEGALSKGYHTLFVSGGAPIWRKSGLSQGFEVFDDVVEIAPGIYYRSAQEVIRLSQVWIENESRSAPFFSVLYLTDLQFPQIATRTKEGEVREKTANAQIEEVTESIGGLVHWLKARRRWNSLNVVLVGLNSVQRLASEVEPGPLSLKSSSVQVTLFIKPARQEKDNNIQWAVDHSVSLVDVGKTMFQWLKLESPESSISELEPESLLPAVTQVGPNWRSDRLILSETAWPDWLEGSGTRWAVRQNQFLFINDRQPLIFNTLTDHMEVMPVKSGDPLWSSLSSEVVELLKKVKAPEWPGMRRRWLKQIEVAQDLWKTPSQRVVTGKEPWSKWYLRRALRNKDWREVKRLATEAGDPIGSYVATKQLGEPGPMPRTPCVRLLLGTNPDKSALRTECDNEAIVALHNWQAATRDEERSANQERFLKILSLQQMDQEIGRLNFINEIRWDVNREWPSAPSAVDYLLTLKDLEPFAKKVLVFFSNKDMAL